MNKSDIIQCASQYQDYYVINGGKGNGKEKV